MAEAVVTAGAATEHAEAPQLAELLNPEAGRTSDIERALPLKRVESIRPSIA